MRGAGAIDRKKKGERKREREREREREGGTERRDSLTSRNDIKG
jgi:hypothetical protein